MSNTPSLSEFGHGTFKQAGRSAIGSRPLLIILGEYSNYPAFNSVHSLDYYELLGFGNPVPPFSTQNPVNPASLREYFCENSNGRFWFDSVEVVEPIQLGVYSGADDPGPEARSAGILKRVAALRPELFINADTNQDQHVGFDELCVLLFENISPLWPANRDNNSFSITSDSWNGTVRVHVAGAGPVTPFYQIAHELSHSLGTVDMYNTGQGNYLLTLMSYYSFDSNDQGTVHLDIWHKLMLGWVEPRLFQLLPSGSAVVHEGVDGAILLWDQTRLTNEYFLIERRSSNSPNLKYDTSFPGDGVLIWHVQKGVVNRVSHLGAPDLIPGGSGVWGTGRKTPSLRWNNGQSTGVRITVTGMADGVMQVSWGE
ncbi:hypothetical protein BHU24_17275 [Bacillus pseudomycoides]|uniref:hypothetical protein n=1 Tax=Bacillus pseudomycoides TaxID=64104 RepID=UPI000BED1C04|nr:hypothetical protein [Bacillus pseudomycoides]MBD5797526.1 hypothetical protein [Bacillus pseudomycoides]MED1476545.1 hypothetical protein [Bacillus pseudomycoides]PDZ08463.1 hypothetical protein CON70_27635 [Bacillus pseudomycoides]PEO78130.1 hypothetical protein CN571_29395 [Bacillus pseudomycoides]